MFEEHAEIYYYLVCVCHWVVTCLKGIYLHTQVHTCYKILYSKTFCQLRRFQMYSEKM